MIVTVVGAGEEARRACEHLLGEGHHVRWLQDARADAPGADIADVPGLDDHAALLLERAAAKRVALEGEGIVIEERSFPPPPVLPSDHPRLEVLDGRKAVAFSADGSRRVTHLHVERADGTGPEDLPVETLVLAADTLTTTRLFLESWRRATGESPRLTGLLRSREIRARFVTSAMIGRPVDERAAGIPRIAITVREAGSDDVRGRILTAEPERLATDVAAVPLDVRTAFRLVREARAGLGSVTLTVADRPRAACFAELGPGGLAVNWEPPTGDPARMGRTIARVRHALQMLGARILGAAPRDDGAAEGYAGTLPSTSDERPFTTRPDGSSRDFQGLWIVGAAAGSAVTTGHRCESGPGAA